MDNFLYSIAKLYYEHHAGEISDFTFVFPNRRAGLFFQKYLGEIAGKPLFSPKITTISQVFTDLSGRQTADRMGMLFRLYDIYKRLKAPPSPPEGGDVSRVRQANIGDELMSNGQMLTSPPSGGLGGAESFDEFAYWGELLLNDFDDIDKHLVDAKSLFTNVRELKEIDRLFDFLTPQQKSAIRQFWESFMPIAESRKQQDFIATWQILFPLYEEFGRELSGAGIAYEGMIYREVAEKIKEQRLKSKDNFVFVGFNALTPAEKVLFRELKNGGIADFYWDYDSSEIQDEKNLASRFVKENLLEFPSKYKTSPQPPPKEGEKAFAGSFPSSGGLRGAIELIGIPSTVGQAKEVRRILAEMNLNEEDFLKTAVVLTDEKMLLPMLHSFPEEIETVNITMGYPLSSTSAASFVEQLFDLQRSVRLKNEQSSFYHIETLALLHHPYLSKNTGTPGERNVNNRMQGEAVAYGDTAHFAEEIKKNKKLFVETEFFKENQVLKTIFSPQKTAMQMADYLLDVLSLVAPKQERLEREFLYHYYKAVKRMKDLLAERNASTALSDHSTPLSDHSTALSDHLEMNFETFAQLVKRLTAMLNIPFEGEPLAGLQVMGVLETRALDFDNLIITSFNEGSFPKRGASPSFIPYNLRKGFGLSTTEHQDAIFAYHFYRLVHRAKRIFLIYDTRTEGLQTGEVSRYLHQLKYHYRIPVNEKMLTADISMKPPQTLQMEKSAKVMQKLLRYTDPQTEDALSASAINAYLDCPLKFYFQYVENLRETKELTESLEASDFGNIFHKTMENIYKTFEGKEVTKELLQEMLKTPVYVEKNLYDAYINVMFNGKYSGDLTGQNLLFASVIKKYVLKMLEIDAQYAPFVYENSEYQTKCSINIRSLSRVEAVKIKAFIDRIDRKDNTVRLVDYKTGNDKSGSKDKRIFSDIAGIFDAGNASRPSEVLQIFLYAYAYFQETKEAKILPNVIFVRNTFKDDLNFGLQQKEGKETQAVTDFQPFLKEYEEALKKCLEEIFNPGMPFTQSIVQKHCEYCLFKTVCGK